MLKINKNSDWYEAVANVLAAAFGFGASILVGGFCDSMISLHSGSGLHKNVMKMGKFGLETVAMYSASTKMREEIDECSDLYNEFAEVVETYQEKKLKEANEKYSKQLKSDKNTVIEYTEE